MSAYMILEIAYVNNCKAILDNDIASRGGKGPADRHVEYSPEKILNGNIMRKKTTSSPIQSLICMISFDEPSTCVL